MAVCLSNWAMQLRIFQPESCLTPFCSTGFIMIAAFGALSVKEKEYARVAYR